MLKELAFDFKIRYTICIQIILFLKFFRKLKFKIPLYKEIAFDEISSAVFMQIDGIKTVKEIGENLEERFGEKVNPLYERLLIFLNHIDINCNYIEKVN